MLVVVLRRLWMISNMRSAGRDLRPALCAIRLNLLGLFYFFFIFRILLLWHFFANDIVRLYYCRTHPHKSRSRCHKNKWLMKWIFLCCVLLLLGRQQQKPKLSQLTNSECVPVHGVFVKSNNETSCYQLLKSLCRTFRLVPVPPPILLTAQHHSRTIVASSS